jgi:murein DD-endopeptidase MepM/ murein hydrolase activator NlpD
VKELDQELVQFFLGFTYVPGEETLFKGVYKLEPGGFLTYDAASGLQLGRFWELTFEPDESKSLDDLQLLSKDKELMAASIPAIWLINKRDLRGHIGAFGSRLHPIHNRYIEHKGLDFGARTGDPVYATGNGEVVISEQGEAKRSYGQQIVIDHGFGYKTRYAHLSKRFVTEGQYVKRGELIGYVGSTGGSTGPHLHYEVLYMNNNVDPINYFRRDMSVEELDEIIEQAKATTFETIE